MKSWKFFYPSFHTGNPSLFLTELNATKEAGVCVYAGVYPVLLCCVKTEYWLENDRNQIFNTNDIINTTLALI